MFISENKNWKTLSSESFNYIFNKINGFTAIWGKTKEENPKYCEFGPIIADIEISTICSGLGKPCSFCYKSNTPKGKNMSFGTFKTILEKLPKTLTQIAFGIGDIDSNLDLWRILEYSREQGIIPNITINGNIKEEEYYNKLVNYCGAVAVSHYDDDVCFNAVSMLTSKINNIFPNNLKQVNIHQLLSEETFNECITLLHKAKTDIRLKDLNAIVFLLLKPKGNRNKLNTIKSIEKFKILYDLAKENNIKIGFDSCSAPWFLNAISDEPEFKEIEQMVDCCESTLFSIYINVNGEFYPCSFTENEQNWNNGLDIVNCNNFLNDIWNNERTIKFRNSLLNQQNDLSDTYRECPTFKEITIKC